MMDWTDTHCRVFHRLLAPGALLYTEMVHANAVIRGDRSRLLAMDPVEHPVALQLGGSDPAALREASRIGAAWGYDEVNLNCGCPSDRVQAGRFGACLMREPALVAECVAAMIEGVRGAAMENARARARARADADGEARRAARPRASTGVSLHASTRGLGDQASVSADTRGRASTIPVTVKCRLGVDDDDDFEQFLAFVDTIAVAGCNTVVVHARNAWLKGLSPKENREVPPLRYDWAYRLKQMRPELEIHLNGGIARVEDCMEHLRHVDGVMLGRAAYHDPYLLHRLHAHMHGAPLQSRDTLLRAMRPYVERQLAAGVPLKHITRHVLGLYAGQPGGRAFRQVLSEGAHRPGADWSLVEAAIATTDRPERSTQSA